MESLNIQDVVREQIPSVDSFNSNDFDQLIKFLFKEFSIKTAAQLKSRFVCANQLISADEDRIENDGCESLEFNEWLIYIKEVEPSPQSCKSSE
jgi:hypothetical protein